MASDTAGCFRIDDEVVERVEQIPDRASGMDAIGSSESPHGLDRLNQRVNNAGAFRYPL